MTNLSVFFEKQAKSLYNIQRSSKELRFWMILMFVGLIVTCVVSIGSSYDWYLNIAKKLVKNPTGVIALTVFALIFAELLTQTTLTLFWRYAFNGKLVAIVFFIVGGSLYWFSWYTSCNGMAMSEGKKVDSTMSIKFDYRGKLAILTNEKENTIKEYTTTIEAIRKQPEGWSGGRACILTKDQRSEINNLYAKIEETKRNYQSEASLLKQSESRDISINTSVVKSAESEYYWIMAGLMIAQIVLNMLVMIFYRVIERESRTTSEQIQEHAEDLRKEGHALAMNMIISDIQTFFIELRNAFLNSGAIAVDGTQKNGSDSKSTTKGLDGRKEINGFAMYKKNVNNASVNNDSNLDTDKTYNTVKKTDTNKKEKTSNIRLCDNCSTEYKLTRLDKRFCCDACRYAWHKANDGFDVEKAKKAKKRKNKK